MFPEYIITKEQIIRINEKYGGALRSDADVETALYRGKGKSIYKKIAYLWRAILVGHPFTDGNKRTALIVTLSILEDCKFTINDVQKERMVNTITRIASENLLDVNEIERLVRYAISGN